MTYRFRRSFAIVAASGIVLAACGGSGDEASGEPAPPVSELPAAQPAVGDTAIGDTAPVDGTAAELSPAESDASDEPAADEPAPATDPPEQDVAVTDAPSDTPVAQAVLGGRGFAEAIAAESDIASNLLPDVVVDDIRRGTKVNFRNLVPGDRPILLWMWAPH